MPQLQCAFCPEFFQRYRLRACAFCWERWQDYPESIPASIVEELRQVVRGVEPRYRRASARGNVMGIESPRYGSSVNLWNVLLETPERAESSARYLLAEFPESARWQAGSIRLVLRVLDGMEHEAPDSQIEAVQRFAGVVEAELRKVA